jgi:phosphoribosylamine---glycine ligase
LSWNPGAAVCVVVAAEGYPGSYRKGDVINGIRQAEANGAMVFHAGTKLKQQQLVSDGGRVLGVTAVGQSLPDALAQVYAAVEQLRLEGMYYRRDIGHRAIDSLQRSQVK